MCCWCCRKQRGSASHFPQPTFTTALLCATSYHHHHSCVCVRVCILTSAVKHNNVIPNAHFHKDWQERVKTWLDQPMRKLRRRLARRAKAAAMAPRPAAGAVRPVVRCQTVRYNMRVRAGRGFTLEELRAAGVNPKVAATVGISVDHRRRNKSVEGLNENVARLKAYMANLVVFPRNSGKKNVGAGEATPEVKATLTQLKGAVMPISMPAAKIEFATVTEELKKASAYKVLRQERCNGRMVGKRALRAKEAAAAGPAE